MFTGFRKALLLFVCLFFTMGQAWAVALGKIEVTSHLGETFFAETPVLLDADEKIFDISIELAGSSDYQILEVFRDGVLNKLSVELKNDERGSRAVISSSEAVDIPYFNLVLKMKHGHATNFKKYPVFLDLPEQVRPVSSQTPVVEQAIAPAPDMQADEAKPSVSAINTHPDDAEVAIEPVAADSSSSAFKPYAGWARAGRYGPMVRGDTISTVALRLSVGQRYTQSQVMVGLFNKNKDKFRENNINLINAGTYLDVPTADEIEAIQDREARRIIKEHGDRWKALKRQPVYAAEAEAQKNRYRTRVHVGQAASGAAAAPVQGGQTTPMAADKKVQKSDAVTDEVAQDKTAQGETAQLQMLQEENLRLQQALKESEAKAADSRPATADAAIAEEQVKKLELTVARLQQQLKQMDMELQEVRSQDMNTLTYALSGIILLLIAVAGYLLFLLRRDRPHPAMDKSSAQPAAEESSPEDGDGEDLGHTALIESLDSDIENTDAIQSLKPQDGVDYVAEAEVYLRYGMEDEALQQLRMGLEQKPNHLQAHSKLVEILHGRGDQVAVAAAVEAARSVLAADDLKAFEDLLPSTESDALEPDGAGAEAGDESNVDLFDDLDMSGFEEPLQDAELNEEQHEASGDGADDSGIELEVDLGEPQESPTESEILETTDIEEPVLNLSEEPQGEAVLDEDEPVAQTASKDDGLDFTLDDIELGDADSAEVPGEVVAESEQAIDDGIAFESSGESIDENEEDVSDEAIDVSVEDNNDLDLDSILGELEKDAGSSVDFVAASDEVLPLEAELIEEEVPETVIETASADEELDLDKILGEFDHMAVQGDADVDANGDDADSFDIASIPDMDVSDELDGLLAEWDEGNGEISADAGPESLDVDRARSLLAEGQLDEAETALQTALDGDRRGDALIGLAEAAAKRGDDARKNELLAEAESFVDESNRDWFDLVKNLSA